jgi:dihydroxyacetone kinase-like predicted kinase
LATPLPPPPPPGELRKVRLTFRCSICGTEVRMTVANDEVPDPPRHCQDEMELVAREARCEIGEVAVFLASDDASYVTGEPLPEAPEEEFARIESAHQELSQFRYCTGFVVEGEELDAESLERELAALGDSLLVVGDESVLKVHVHTDDPGRALQLATAIGVVEAVEVANMHRQTAEREGRLLEAADTTATALVAVSVGDGNRRLFESSGAIVVDGGETMNPSTRALLNAIQAAPAAEVVVLPNNPNVFMAAEEAASLAGKPVHVVRSGSIQAGLAAAIAHDGARPGDEDAAELTDAVEAIRYEGISIAVSAGSSEGIFRTS